MLLIGGKTEAGHVLHLIVGPESEFHMDVHGSQLLDITPLLIAMNGSSKIFVSLTRCKSEANTSQLMDVSSIPHLNSFAKTGVVGATSNISNTSDTSNASNASDTSPVGFPDIADFLEQPAPKTGVKRGARKSKAVDQSTVQSGQSLAIKPGKCAYCGAADTELLPVPGFEICAQCAQIELGKARPKTPDKMDGAKT